jgi:hypothetical protein
LFNSSTIQGCAAMRYVGTSHCLPSPQHCACDHTTLISACQGWARASLTPVVMLIRMCSPAGSTCSSRTGCHWSVGTNSTRPGGS